MLKERITKIGKIPREVQHQYSQAVEKGLSCPHKISFIQAETGVGKSLGFMYSGIKKILETPGSRLIVASNTINLLHVLHQDVIPDIKKLFAPGDKKTGDKKSDTNCPASMLTSSLLIGVENYVSEKRLQSYIREAKPDDLIAEHEAINTLLGWRKEINAYIDEYGKLPLGLKPEQICQTVYAKEDWLKEDRQDALAADILLVTHSMLACDVLLGGDLLERPVKTDTDETRDETVPTYLIIDEADQFYDALTRYQQIRLNLVDLKSGLKRLTGNYSKAFETTLDELVNRVESSCEPHKSFKPVSDKESQELMGLLEDIIARLNTCHDEMAIEIKHDIKKVISAQYRAKTGVGRSRILSEPAIVMVDPFFTRRFGQYAKNKASTLLTSATLSNGKENKKGIAWIAKAFDIGEDDYGVVDFFAPEHFGTLHLVLGGAGFPSCYVESRSAKNNDDNAEKTFNKHWLLNVSNYLKNLESSARVLVLTHSFQESAALNDYFDTPDAIMHQPGQKLGDIVKHFKQNKLRFLVTPGGKVGLNIRDEKGKQLLTHIVITRLPFSPPNRVEEEGFVHYLETHTEHVSPESFARNYFYSKNLNNTIRILRQAIGRGIRDKDDVITIAILDNRFPEFAALNNLKPLKNAIPARFKKAYQNAEILSSPSGITTQDTDENTDEPHKPRGRHIW